MKNKNFRVKGKMSDCGKTNFEFLFSHYSTLFNYKLGLLSHFLPVFYLFLPVFDFLHSLMLSRLTLQASHFTPHAYELDKPNKRDKPNQPDRPDMSNVDSLLKNSDVYYLYPTCFLV